MLRGGNRSCVLNAANEIAVDAFLKEQISFTGMSDLIEKTMEQVDFIAHPSLGDYVETDRKSRCVAREWMKKLRN